MSGESGAQGLDYPWSSQLPSRRGARGHRWQPKQIPAEAMLGCQPGRPDGWQEDCPALGVPPEGQHDSHQAPRRGWGPRERQLSCWKQTDARGDGQWWGLGASRRRGIHGLWLERRKAVGSIWSLAYFTQPISPEVWLPKAPGAVMRGSLAGTRGRGCASGWEATPRLLFFEPILGKGQMAAAALCFFFFFFWWGG